MTMIYRSTKGAPLSFYDIDGNFKACLGVHNILHLLHTVTTSAGGGTFTSGAWRTRPLNTVLLNNINGSSLVENQVTLPAGTYFAEGMFQAYRVDSSQARLQRISPISESLVIGSAEYVASSINANVSSHISGKFILESESVIEAQHISSATYASYGMGSLGGVFAGSPYHIYGSLKIWKLA